MYSTGLPLPPNATNEKGTRDCVIRCVAKLVAWFKPSFQFVYVNHLCTWNPGQKEFALGTRAETMSPEVHLSGKGAADIIHVYRCAWLFGGEIDLPGLSKACVCDKTWPSPFPLSALNLPPVSSCHHLLHRRNVKVPTHPHRHAGSLHAQPKQQWLSGSRGRGSIRVNSQRRADWSRGNS